MVQIAARYSPVDVTKKVVVIVGIAVAEKLLPRKDDVAEKYVLFAAKIVGSSVV